MSDWDPLRAAMEKLLVEWHSPHRLPLMKSLMHQLPPGDPLRAVIHGAVVPKWRHGADERVRSIITDLLKREGENITHNIKQQGEYE